MALDQTQIAAWERDGFLVVPDAIDARPLRGADRPGRRDRRRLRPVDRVDLLHPGADPHLRRVLPGLRRRASPASSRRRRSTPTATCASAKAQSINKIGHALHDLDPVFDAFSRQPGHRRGRRRHRLRRPAALQSMYIFKSAPHRRRGHLPPGLDVPLHRPHDVVGFWVALQDATLENGCLWAQPGGHRTPAAPALRARAPTAAPASRSSTTRRSPSPAAPTWCPLEAEPGTLVLLHGLLPHWSDVNRTTAAATPTPST